MLANFGVFFPLYTIKPKPLYCESNLSLLIVISCCLEYRLVKDTTFALKEPDFNRIVQQLCKPKVILNEFIFE